MPAPPRRPRVLLVASEDALTEFEKRLRRHAKIRRAITVRTRPVAAGTLRRRLARLALIDGVILTSPAAVSAFVIPVLARIRPEDWRRLRYWVSGPTTADRLRQIGGPTAVVARPEGAEGIVRSLTNEPPRRLIYPRSDRAGTLLAKRLRRHGHRVRELVAYRHLSPRRGGVSQRQWAASANFVIVTSPSAFAGLRRSVGATALRQLRSQAEWFAVGRSTARALGDARIRAHLLSSESAAQRFTQRLFRYRRRDARR
jgi:uroporphyrinogen-III synthase